LAYRKTEARELHTDAVRNRILDSTRNIISREGVHSLTVRKIINEASSSTGNFYFYFHDKNELIGILIETDLAAVGCRIDAAASAARQAGATVYGVLATMVYSGIRIGLESDSQRSLIYHPDLRSLVFPKLETLMIERTRRFFESTEVLPEGLNPELAAVLWQGSILFLIERGGITNQSTAETAEACASWNLRALGLTDSNVVAALAIARQVWSSEEDEYPGKSR
jgi:AcrR family transcriptional regulator